MQEKMTPQRLLELGTEAYRSGRCKPVFGEWFGGEPNCCCFLVAAYLQAHNIKPEQFPGKASEVGSTVEAWVKMTGDEYADSDFVLGVVDGFDNKTLGDGCGTYRAGFDIGQQARDFAMTIGG